MQPSGVTPACCAAWSQPSAGTIGTGPIRPREGVLDFSPPFPPCNQAEDRLVRWSEGPTGPPGHRGDRASPLLSTLAPASPPRTGGSLSAEGEPRPVSATPAEVQGPDQGVRVTELSALLTAEARIPAECEHGHPAKTQLSESVLRTHATWACQPCRRPAPCLPHGGTGPLHTLHGWTPMASPQSCGHTVLCLSGSGLFRGSS